MDAKLIKEFACQAGAHACGIAGIDRFAEAPAGFRPTDVYSKCRSVVAFIKPMPGAAIWAENPIPYTHAAFKMYDEMDGIGLELCRFLQSNKVGAVPVPADTPYLYWDQANMQGKGIISLKHAAVRAGLGIMGRSTIFINKDLGNMGYLGAVLIDAAVEADPLVEDFRCPPACRRCLDACPQQAMDGVTVTQKLCRPKSFIKGGRDWDIYNCSECRKVCPLRLGLRRAE